MRFTSRLADGRLKFGIAPETGAAATPTSRTFDLKVHNIAGRPRAVQAGGKPVGWRWDANKRLLEVTLPAVRSAPLQVVVTLQPGCRSCARATAHDRRAQARSARERDSLHCLSCTAELRTAP